MAITQKCPVCKSARIRLGYRSTPFWSKLIFRYNLLCDNCNWQFVGFAIPGTVSTKSSKKSKNRKKSGTTDNAGDEASATLK